MTLRDNLFIGICYLAIVAVIAGILGFAIVGACESQRQQTIFFNYYHAHPITHTMAP